MRMNNIYIKCRFHPAYKIPGAEANRKKRARQLFLYLLTQHLAIPEPGLLEDELNSCFNIVKKYAGHLLTD